MATLREVCEQLERGGMRLRPSGAGGWYKPNNWLREQAWRGPGYDEREAEVRPRGRLRVCEPAPAEDTALEERVLELTATPHGTEVTRPGEPRWFYVARVVEAPARRLSYSGRRDSQRSKLYKAERALADGAKLPSVEDIEQYLDKLQAKRWWRWNRRPIRVRDGRGHRNATGGGWCITLPKWARTERVVLHEVAHNLAGADKHGRDFARVYLELVTRMMGPEQGAVLRRAYVERGVHWKARRQLTPAQLEQLRARGRALAAAAKVRREGGA